MQIRRQHMDDGKLRALLTAVECDSFSKAAAQLGLYPVGNDTSGQQTGG